MKIYRKNPLTRSAAALLFTMLLASPASAGHHEEPKADQADIVEVAVATGDFNTLAAALQAAGLVETLQGEGPFTVFAPTDAAFAKLPAGTVENLLKPENKDQLIAVLTYHVVAGKVTAAEVVELDSAGTVNGEAINISVIDGGVRINQATVTVADVEASNGVIHVIDEVILPPAS
jgi:uncharacterized surface protein with fasciclin (FAS1) repeats